MENASENFRKNIFKPLKLNRDTPLIFFGGKNLQEKEKALVGVFLQAKGEDR